MGEETQQATGRRFGWCSLVS